MCQSLTFIESQKIIILNRFHTHLLFFLDNKLSVSCFVDIAVLVHILEAGALHVDGCSCDIERVIITKMMPRTNPINRELATTVSVRKEEDGQHQQNFHRIHLHHFITISSTQNDYCMIHCLTLESH